MGRVGNRQSYKKVIVVGELFRPRCRLKTRVLARVIRATVVVRVLLVNLGGLKSKSRTQFMPLGRCLIPPRLNFWWWSVRHRWLRLLGSGLVRGLTAGRGKGSKRSCRP